MLWLLVTSGCRMGGSGTCLEVIFWCGGVLDTCLVAARASSSSSSSCDMQSVVWSPNVFACMSVLSHGFAARVLMAAMGKWLVVLSTDLLVGSAHAFVGQGDWL